MKNGLVLIAALILIVACSPYQNALKSEDNMVKVAMIDTMMSKGKYGKSLALFDQVKNAYRGTDSAAPMALKYGEALYKNRDFLLSANQYERFTTSHPTHPEREMAAYMSARSYYEESTNYIYSKDQGATKFALAKLQDYINMYPQGEYLEEANTMVSELRTKLDKKDFEIARNYHHRTRYIPAIASFENFIIEHPGSEYQDDAHFYILDSEYQYAMLSQESKVAERLAIAKNYYDTFARRFPNSEYMEDANKILKEIEAYKPKTEL